MRATPDPPGTPPSRPTGRNPVRLLFFGIVPALLALIILVRAPQFAVMCVALGFIAVREWIRVRPPGKRPPEALRDSRSAAADTVPPAVKQHLPPLLVRRRARQPGVTDWSGARSWLGGAPKLGSIPWPRSQADGRPLPFLAQIDLADVADQIGSSPLPGTGSLAFFVGEHPVTYVPATPAPQSSPVPADAPTLEDAGYSGIGITVWQKDPFAPRLFPFWPVDLMPMPADLACRQSSFHARAVFQLLGEPPRPQWWHSALHFADCLRIASAFSIPNKLKVREQFGVANEKIAAADAAFREGIPRFQAFADEVMDWVRGKNPWAFLSPADADRLETSFHRGRTEFQEYTRSSLPYSMEALITVTLLALATADDQAYATLPLPVRQLINEQYLLPAGNPHQIFGEAIEIQGGATALAETNYLLLRLNYDDMMHWGFGDNGAYHFFISPDDLARRNWGAARIIFECH